MNLEECAALTGSLEIACPDDEILAPLGEVARALQRLMVLRPTGDLVVTLGPRGCLAAERATGTVLQVCLGPRPAAWVRAALREAPGRINGSGDRFFALLVRAHCGTRTGGRRGGIAPAAVSAVAGVLRSYDLGLDPTPDWVVVRRIWTGGARTRAAAPRERECGGSTRAVPAPRMRTAFRVAAGPLIRRG